MRMSKTRSNGQLYVAVLLRYVFTAVLLFSRVTSIDERLPAQVAAAYIYTAVPCYDAKICR